MRDSNKTLSVIFHDSSSNVHQKGINKLHYTTSHGLLTAGRDGIVRQWDTSGLTLTSSYKGHIHWVNDIEVSNSLLFSASSDSRILVWPLGESDSPKSVNTIYAHKDYIHSIKFINDTLFSAGEDGIIIQTDLDYKNHKFFASPLSIWNLDCSQHLVAVAFSSKVLYN